mmetsp:Transcript_11157/g.37990  ORF Transcript_11157/g.37990 Transcript_11157/m.37990 type:complete len:220 (-) Transcript_11157:385-1044(-)
MAVRGPLWGRWPLDCTPSPSPPRSLLALGVLGHGQLLRLEHLVAALHELCVLRLREGHLHGAEHAALAQHAGDGEEHVLGEVQHLAHVAAHGGHLPRVPQHDGAQLAHGEADGRVGVALECDHLLGRIDHLRVEVLDRVLVHEVPEGHAPAGAGLEAHHGGVPVLPDHVGVHRRGAHSQAPRDKRPEAGRVQESSRAEDAALGEGEHLGDHFCHGVAGV